ncbi:MAG: hypothetical protein IT219_07115 [Bacteroidales bacterium]|jgi:hypothetical protein|nr:hypothetical protein [Bacteroidales bacterium]
MKNPIGVYHLEQQKRSISKFFHTRNMLSVFVLLPMACVIDQRDTL